MYGEAWLVNMAPDGRTFLSQDLTFYLLSFGQKSIGQTSFSQHVMVIPVGWNIMTSNVIVNWGHGR